MKILHIVKNQDKNTFSYNIYFLKFFMLKLSIVILSDRSTHINITTGIWPFEFGIILRLWRIGKK